LRLRPKPGEHKIMDRRLGSSPGLPPATKGDPMAKGQMRSNREKKKPKKDKPKASPGTANVFSKSAASPPRPAESKK
jgi:hypothetical protein